MKNKINNLLDNVEKIINNKEQLTENQKLQIKEIAEKLISSTKDEINWEDYNLWN